MGGGIPRGHVVLISGNPGTYKSSFAYNVLYHNAMEENKRGLYISFQQSRDSLQDQFNSLNMPYEEVADRITIVDVGYLRQTMKPHPQDWIEVFKRYVETYVQPSGTNFWWWIPSQPLRSSHGWTTRGKPYSISSNGYEVSRTSHHSSSSSGPSRRS